MIERLQIYKDAYLLTGKIYEAMPHMEKMHKHLIGAIDERWWKIAFVENRFKKVTLKKGFTIREIIKIKIKRQQALNKRKRNGKNKADQREVRSDS